VFPYDGHSAPPRIFILKNGSRSLDWRETIGSRRHELYDERSCDLRQRSCSA
jgi:hypothetical protein